MRPNRRSKFQQDIDEPYGRTDARVNITATGIIVDRSGILNSKGAEGSRAFRPEVVLRVTI